MSSRMGNRSTTADQQTVPRLGAASTQHHRAEGGSVMSDTELKELKMVFRLTDRNNDGSITAEELKRMLLDKLDIDVDDALIGELMTSAAGEKDDGLISEGQFITWFLKMQSLSAEKTPDQVTNDLFAAFRLFDKDGNGFITLDELRRAMDLIEERMTEAELSSLIEMADADKDGKINYEGVGRHLSGDGGAPGGGVPPESLPSLLEPTLPSVDQQWSGSLYPEGSRGRQSQARRSLRPAVDPRATSVLLFPGQGAQRVGMVDKLLHYPNVADMFAEASSLLGYDLLELCRRGPAERLDRTEHAQPALLVTSLAAVERLRDERPRAVDTCMAAAGFSVGELAALTFSGALTFPAAVRLAQVRGQAMQLASEMAPSGMMTVMCRPDARLGLACSLARRWCEERDVVSAECRVASFLFPQCKVVAGSVEALEFIAERAAEFGLRRCTRLRVSGAFHTPLMAPAVEPLRAALADTRISAPQVPVYSNVDGRRYHSAEHVRKQLVQQLTRPVKWEQTMHVLYERSADVPFPSTYECGPGDTLTAILRKVNAKAADSCESVEV